MKRRITKQGHNTLTITLPSEWTKRLSLTPGQEIELLERENGLFVTAQRNGHKLKRAEFDISEMDIPTIWKYFMAIYIEDYDEFLVKFHPGTRLDNPYKFMTVHRLDLRY